MRLPAAEHEDDAFDRIVIFLKTELTERGALPDGDVANVANPNGHAFVAADHDVADVIGIAHQPDAAHVVELSALRIESAAGVGVVGRKSVDHLRNGQVISIDSGGIKQHLILHRRAAEPGIVGNARNRAISAAPPPSLQWFSIPAECGLDFRST